MWCGTAQKKDRKKRMYQRPDGLFEKVLTLDGKRVAFRGKTEAEVFKKISAYEAKKEASRTFQEVADEWEDYHFNSISLTTQKTYKPCIKRALETFGEIPIKDITSQMVQNFMEAMGRKDFAQKTVANQRIVLNLIFDYAGLHDGLLNNPMDFTKIPKGLKKTARELPSDADIRKIKENVNHTFGLFPFFILYTGCRRGEALALQFKDIDRENKVIHIRKSIFFFTNKPEIKEPKTKAGIRDLPLLDVLAEQLPDGRPDDFVFSPDGQPYHSSRLTRAWKKYCEDTGVSCTPHQLRHAYATMLYEAGIDRKDAQSLMGHADITTTENIYTHISNAQRERTSRILNDFTKNSQQ